MRCDRGRNRLGRPQWACVDRVSSSNEAIDSYDMLCREEEKEVHTGKRWFNAQVQVECADCQMLVVGKARLSRIGEVAPRG
jgi:hypothetical protein